MSQPWNLNRLLRAQVNLTSPHLTLPHFILVASTTHICYGLLSSIRDLLDVRRLAPPTAQVSSLQPAEITPRSQSLSTFGPSASSLQLQSPCQHRQFQVAPRSYSQVSILSACVQCRTIGLITI
ncbi:hypothetical protein HRR83_000881 [Exophiala dermatitidis]|uniref:Uncharacterized protein n=1 Tax=Exophiala dermatitidis TaxID=5970 RepID=A0AAN6F255_EXODE|nr:hypothetical protein HRR74_000885 [Exophiala dermatitidis]KAJ4528763.1 hypothetical protein HRR73_001386 [Exophiala dermatitidis]KAJ4530149.1 hypothetical protein HRR76_009382 [Exophiala dermatitidis]KAJ4558915.1 hypothetical protein HRR77_000884 [Exophiala dermatitidis]KAJ4581063.1 hypothetical protein HRR79_000114 [Exophiala dermatitidis]